MKKIHKKFKANVKPEPHTLIIHCVDCRFLGFEEFIEEHLGIDRRRNALIMEIAGGLAPLASLTRTPSRFKYLAKQLRFKCNKFPSIQRIVGIAHKSCAYYDTIDLNSDDIFGDIERTDLQLAGGHLMHLLPKKKIELYHARLVDGDEYYEIEGLNVTARSDMRETISAFSSKILC